MANRINWAKVHTSKLMKQSRENAYHDERINRQLTQNHKVANSDVWLLGKHKGKPISKLPVNYLCYVSEKFDETSPYKLRADRELKKRYRLIEK